MESCEYKSLINDVREKALKEGREEAWDLARRIAAFGEDTYTWLELDSVFGSYGDNIIFEMPVDEALAKDKEYQKEKKTLHIGDEVEFIGSNPKYKVKVNELMTGYVIGFEDSLSGEPFVRILTKKHGTYRRSLICLTCLLVVIVLVWSMVALWCISSSLTSIAKRLGETNGKLQQIDYAHTRVANIIANEIDDVYESMFDNAEVTIRRNGIEEN